MFKGPVVLLNRHAPVSTDKSLKIPFPVPLKIFFKIQGESKKSAIGKKLTIVKKHHTGEFHKKDTILHQVPLITLFFDSPCTCRGSVN